MHVSSIKAFVGRRVGASMRNSLSVGPCGKVAEQTSFAIIG